ncbi:MAG: hypothetical protein ACM359_22830 [Bacillota bacterium]
MALPGKRRVAWAVGLLGLYVALGGGLWQLFEDTPGRDLPLEHRVLLIAAVLCGVSIDLIRFKYAWRSVRHGIDFGFGIGAGFAGVFAGLAIAGAVFCGVPWEEVGWCVAAGCAIALYGGLAGAFTYMLLFLNVAILLEGLVSGHAFWIGGVKLAVWSNLLELWFGRSSIGYEWMAAVTAAAISCVVLWARPLSY